MKPRASTVLFLLLACFSGGAASADTELRLGLKAGTLGLGAELAWRPLPWFDLRGGFNAFDYDDDGTEAGIDYDATLELQTIYATLNALVPATPFRFTAGYFSNDNRLLLQSLESGPVTVGGTTWSAAEVGTLRSETGFRRAAPYAGIGLDFGLFGNVGMNIDVGVLFQGDPDVTLTSSGLLANDPVFLQALETERLELLDEVDEYESYPVASIGFNLRFR